MAAELGKNARDSRAGSERVRRVAVYYCVTFLLTHALVAGYLLSGGSLRRLDSFAFANLTMLVPGLVAACTARFYYRQPVRRVLGLSTRLNRWFVLAWLGPLLLSGATFLYTFIRIRAESTLACAICHGSFGASMLLTFAPVAGGSELSVGLLAFPGVLILGLSNVVLACLPARYRA